MQPRRLGCADTGASAMPRFGPTMLRPRDAAVTATRYVRRDRALTFVRVASCNRAAIGVDASRC
ncbi:hypothetical protein C6P87_05715 [Burkholderia sp. AU12872]|nr:hypothetical protein EGY28_12425 [Burkholderia dolosa]PRE54345.1 hypothetical protein C6P87_05715 [Burkholderia sp. AU12872]